MSVPTFTPEELAKEDRLGKYNGGGFDRANNPYGLDDGGSQDEGLFVKLLGDFTGWGRALVREFTKMLGAAESAAALAAEDAANTGGDRVATSQDRLAVAADKADTKRFRDEAEGFSPAGYAQLVSPAFTGNPTAPTPAPATNSTAIATTAFVKSLKATGADVRALNDDLDYVTPKAMADAMAFVTAAATATIAPNLGQGFNRIYTMGLNATLGQPSNMKDGLTVVFGFQQDATGGRTLAFNSTYNKFPGGTVPTLSTAANAYDFMSGVCRNRGGTLVVEWSGLLKDVR